MLFDDIPFLQQAQKEHDFFAETLRNKGVDVLYLEDLAAESLTSTGLKEQFVAEYLQEANIQSENTRKVIEEYLLSISDNRELIDRTMAGLRKNEMKIAGHQNLTDLVDDQYPFLIDPMPNLYFTRDPFATIGNSVSLNRMYSETRRRETLYGKYIFNYHPIRNVQMSLQLKNWRKNYLRKNRLLNMC